MNEQLSELLKESSPEARDAIREKVVDFEAEKLVRDVKKALQEAGFRII